MTPTMRLLLMTTAISSGPTFGSEDVHAINRMTLLRTAVDTDRVHAINRMTLLRTAIDTNRVHAVNRLTLLRAP